MSTATFDIAAGRLAGKVALVVGGGATNDDWPGTGSAMARLFAAAGARVAVMGRTPEKVARTVRQIVDGGGEALEVIGDASVEAEARSGIEQIERTYGRLDVLVNNIGVGAQGSVTGLPMAEWDRVVASNLTSVLLMTRFAEPLLAASGSGSVVNVGSVAGMRAAGSVAYGTTKGALAALTREMALDLGARGIRVNLVVPGHMHTPAGSGFVAEDARRMRREINMLGVEGTAWDVAWAALFLACDEARFITAATLPVDAGATEVMPLRAVASDRSRRA